MALGGPATLREPRALEDAQAFFQRLEELASREALEPGQALEVGIADLYARPDPTAGPQIQIMTIHQAKGLEFDIVVLPRLGDGRSASDEPLLRWLEIPHAVGGRRRAPQNRDTAPRIRVCRRCRRIRNCCRLRPRDTRK